MKWNLKINGKTVTWEESDVVAVVPPKGFPRPHPEREKPYGKYSCNGNGNGNGYVKERPDREQLARQTFEQAGWKFVDRKTLPPKENGKGLPSGDIRQVFTNRHGDVLVETDVATVQLNAAAVTTPYAAQKILAEDGLTIIRQLSFAPHLYTVRLPAGRSLPETINALQYKTHRYVFVEPNMLQRMNGREAPNDPELGIQWQHEGRYGLHSLDAWPIATGSGVRVAIIDNGMDINHPDLREGIVGGGYFDNEPGAGTATFFRFHTDMTDFPTDFPHGTACMAMVGARQNNGIEGSGIAPDSQLLAIACALDQLGTQETLARAIAYAINPQAEDPDDPTPGAHVISCSLATSRDVTSVLARAIDHADSGRDQKGVPVFWAVDNVKEPVSLDGLFLLENVIPVGRSGETGRVAIRCAFGPELEFLAPGINVIGPIWDGINLWSGTSFATPLAAGVAALVLQKHPEFRAADVLQRLRDTCDMPANSDPLRYGHGRINAFRAVQEPT